jgi:hypothetical protein
MKYRLFLLPASIMLAGICTARADCVTTGFKFPAPGNPDIPIKSGICIADKSGTAAKLRWDNNGDGALRLWDSDEKITPIPQLWCAHDSTGACATGSQLCAQQDGNLVIYKELTGTCKGTAVWASGTKAQNVNGERLTVADFGSGIGERAVIANNWNSGTSTNIVWHSDNSESD